MSNKSIESIESRAPSPTDSQESICTEQRSAKKYLANENHEVSLSGCGWFSKLKPKIHGQHRKTRFDYLCIMFRGNKIQPHDIAQSSKVAPYSKSF